MTGGSPIAADRIDGWTYIHIPIERFAFAPILDTSLSLRTFNLVRSWRPDAVHLITMKPLVFSGLASIAARLFVGEPKRVVMTVPGLGRMMSASASSKPGLTFVRMVSEAVIRFIAARQGVHFTFETADSRDYWVGKKLISAHNATVIDGAGVDPKEFYPSSGTRKGRKAKVLFASRLLKSKGLDAFLKMARQMADCANVEFAVAGMVDANDPDGISPSQLRHCKDIVFHGEVKDMPALLRECDVVCLPTRYGEGIPRILIEAAASGLPAIVSNVPGCREVVVDGLTGQIVSAEGDEAMAVAMGAALSKYLENPELIEAHGAAAYRLFKSRRFDQGSVVSRFLVLFGIGRSDGPADDALKPAAGSL
jgi:glycosyltransferase involved in cell wall biosynthesis